MARSNPFYVLFVRFLATLVVLTSLCSSLAQAGMVSTDTLLTSQHHALSTDRIDELLQQAEARKALERLGVDPVMVQNRLKDLTPEELSTLHQQLDQMQAGGSSIIGIAIFVFLVLILLDLLGTTDIFPAIKPIKVN